MKITWSPSEESSDAVDYTKTCIYKMSKTHALFGCCRNCANAEQFEMLKANNR